MKADAGYRIAEPSRREIAAADYAQVFEMLRRWSGFETEEKVAQAFFDLFQRICAPALQGYLSGREDRPVTWLTSPAATPLPGTEPIPGYGPFRPEQRI